MRSCREITRLIAESELRRLKFGERLELAMHTVLCGTCRFFLKLQRRIRQAAHAAGDRIGAPLLTAARDRLEQTVRAALDEGERPA